MASHVITQDCHLSQIGLTSPLLGYVPSPHFTTRCYLCISNSDRVLSRVPVYYQFMSCSLQVPSCDQLCPVSTRVLSTSIKYPTWGLFISESCHFNLSRDIVPSSSMLLVLKNVISDHIDNHLEVLTSMEDVSLVNRTLESSFFI
jgi:hypothetical protein